MIIFNDNMLLFWYINNFFRFIISEKDNLIQSLYEDKVKGIITEDLFIKLSKQYETDKKTLLNRFQKDSNILYLG